MSTLHTLLSRQLKRHFGSVEAVPEVFRDFVEVVDRSYKEFDTDREMLERSLELSSNELLQVNAELRAVFETLPELFIWTDAEGGILNAHGHEPKLGLSSRHLIGRSVEDIPIKTMAARFSVAIEEVARTRKPVTLECEINHAGEVHHFESRILPLVGGQLLGVVRNVTHRVRDEHARHRSSRLDSLGVLAGGIAHDFNNLLTIIMANLSLAQVLIEPSSEATDILEEIHQAALRTQDLTHQLLTFSKGGAPIKTTASVGDLVRETTSFALRGAKVGCAMSIDDDLKPVDIDQGQISQVLSNLVINAVQAMVDGGTITIRAYNIPPTALVPGRVCISVEDEGPGIAPDLLDRIFDPYFTTKAQGSGLGLATSHSIIAKHGGSLEVGSVEGGGAIFRVFLPMSEQDVPERISSSRMRVHGRGRVLLLDDEIGVLNTAARMLGHLGYEAVCALSSDQAIDLFAQSREGDPFVAVIMDLTIPGSLGGAELLPWLREIDPGIRAIVSSGYSNNPVMAMHRDHGFQAVLAKPYDLESLRRALRTMEDSPDLF